MCEASIGKVDAKGYFSLWILLNFIHQHVEVCGTYFYDGNVDEVYLLVMKSIVDVLTDNAYISSWICNIFGFDWLKAFAIIGQNEDVFVLVVHVSDHRASPHRISHNRFAF